MSYAGLDVVMFYVYSVLALLSLAHVILFPRHSLTTCLSMGIKQRLKAHDHFVKKKKKNTFNKTFVKVVMERTNDVENYDGRESSNV